MLVFVVLLLLLNHLLQHKLHNNNNNNNKFNYLSSDLEIKNVRIEDEGVYICSLNNYLSYMLLYTHNEETGKSDKSSSEDGLLTNKSNMLIEPKILVITVPVSSLMTSSVLTYLISCIEITYVPLCIYYMLRLYIYYILYIIYLYILLIYTM